MHKSYAVGKATPGLYTSPLGMRPRVTVERDERGQLVASCEDQESLDYFTDQMLGFVTGIYRPFMFNGLHADSPDELLFRAALWEAEANSGFKPHRRESCLAEAQRLFERAMHNA